MNGKHSSAKNTISLTASQTAINVPYPCIEASGGGRDRALQPESSILLELTLRCDASIMKDRFAF